MKQMKQTLRADRFKAYWNDVSKADAKKYKSLVRNGATSKPLPTEKPKTEEPIVDLWAAPSEKKMGRKKERDWKWLQDTKPKTARVVLP